MMPAAFHVAALDLQLSRTVTSRRVAVSLLSRVNTAFCDWNHCPHAAPAAESPSSYGPAARLVRRIASDPRM